MDEIPEGNDSVPTATAASSKRHWNSRQTNRHLKDIVICIDTFGVQQFQCPLYCVNKCEQNGENIGSARSESVKPVKPPTSCQCARQSFDRGRAEMDTGFDLAGFVHTRDKPDRRVEP